MSLFWGKVIVEFQPKGPPSNRRTRQDFSRGKGKPRHQREMGSPSAGSHGSRSTIYLPGLIFLGAPVQICGSPGNTQDVKSQRKWRDEPLCMHLGSPGDLHKVL